MYNVNSPWTISELVNRLDDTGVLYVNLETRQIIVYKEFVKDSKSLKRIPENHELYPYQEAVKCFCEKKKMELSSIYDAREILEKQDMLNEFLDFWSKRLVKKLSTWFRTNKIMIDVKKRGTA